MTHAEENSNLVSSAGDVSIDTLIIGQGISGSFLSWYLLKKGKRIRVIDDPDPFAPSRIAAGVINPVTGRRHVSVWKVEEILPFALNAYRELGHELETSLIRQKSLIDFFPSAQMRLSFLERLEEKNPYLHAFPEQNQFNPVFNYEFGCGEIRPVYSVHLEKLLPAWRKKLTESGDLIEQKFDPAQLSVEEDQIRYPGISAQQIIFCDGISSATLPFFEALPFAPNKGEALVVRIEELPDEMIYKRGMMLVPLSTSGLFWWGSDYQWEFNEAGPTENFRKAAEWQLRQWLRLPFQIEAHIAGIRPATLERRPFVGMHPHYPRVGALNGMGTKGCSLAPFFAAQLADHLNDGSPVLPEASLSRFSKLLTKR